MTSNNKLKILSGVILKRNPVVLRKPNTFEREYVEYFRQKNVTKYPNNFFKLKKQEERETPKEYSGGDGKDLNRHLDRTLYLVVKNDKCGFEFPTCNVNESLYDSARDTLNNLGEDLRYWIVGNAPVAVIINSSSKIFFMKSQIFAGGIKGEHLWLTKEELSKYLDKKYFESISDALADN